MSGAAQGTSRRGLAIRAAVGRTMWCLLAASSAACMPEDYLGTPVSTDICPSGLMWTHGDEGSTKMFPGSDCNDCHRDEGEGPIYAGAGTVFVFENERDNCFGVPEAEVSLRFADGKTATARTNSAGNFWFMPGDGPYQMPFQVAVGYAGQWEQADEIHDDMNCGKCHDGRSEEQRITIP